MRVLNIKNGDPRLILSLSKGAGMHGEGNTVMSEKS